MSRRFFVDSPIDSDTVELAGAEAQHLIQVMRADVGDAVILFDGSGFEFDARVCERRRATARLEVLARREVDRELPTRITLGVALPKGDRQRWLIEKAVELGVAAIVPLETARGVAQPVAGALERLQRAVIEASKQCGRNRLLEIREPLAVAAFLASKPMEVPGWLAHPGGLPLTSRDLATAGAHGVWLAVGPEGGFAEGELPRDALDPAGDTPAAAWRAIDLGPRILRIETAALALAAFVALGGGR